MISIIRGIVITAKKISDVDEAAEYIQRRLDELGYAIIPPKVPNPVGSFRDDRNGYRMIWTGNEWSMEHRLVMEMKHGRKLGKKEVVHHINGDTSDNRVNNLMVLTYRQHSNVHALLRRIKKNASVNRLSLTEGI